MRRGSAFLLCLMALIFLLATNLFAQNNTENFQSRIIERFDDPVGTKLYSTRQNFRWIVRGSKFINEKFINEEGYLNPKWVETYPDALFTRNNPLLEGVTARSLGVEAAFNRTGYNYLEFIPVADEKDENGKPVPQGIPIPGDVKNLDFWVWGSDYNYYMEIHLQDYRGMSYTLPMGTIKFQGWKNLKVAIPSYIPKKVVYVSEDQGAKPERRGVELVKIVLWTNPGENVSGFYVYLDQIKVFTDLSEHQFDGGILADPDEVENLWNEGVN